MYIITEHIKRCFCQSKAVSCFFLGFLQFSIECNLVRESGHETFFFKHNILVFFKTFQFNPPTRDRLQSMTKVYYFSEILFYKN